MNAEDLSAWEEQFTAVLLACDQALAAGQASAEASPLATPAGRNELERDVGCLRLLHKVLPRTGAAAAAAAAPPAAPPFGTLGRFALRRELGRGAFGMVFLAYDPQMDRDVALKVPRPDALVTPEFRERFVREARAAAGLDHPNVVAVHEAGEVGPVCYIASAYCPGMTLAAWLKGRSEPVPMASAARLVAALAEAVQHAHSRGVVHRDLKPGNILLAVGQDSNPVEGKTGLESCPTRPPADLDLVPKVTDFGLAKLTAALPGGETDEGRLTQTGAVVGTPAYMAPEQASGRNREVGPAADLYALGAILYELLTGRPPFVGETPLETLEQVRTQEPVPPRRLRPKVPCDLETICLKCLEKEAGKRYPSAAALAGDLRSFLAGTPIRARPIGFWERGLKWGRWRPAAAALLAVSGGSAVALLAVILGYNAQLREKNAGLAAGIAQVKQQQAQTRAALDMLSSEVIDEWLSRQKQLSPGHKKFLEQALASYEELAQDTGQDKESRSAVAHAHGRVGEIRHRLGQRAGAEAAYRRACELYQQLAGEFPTKPEYRYWLAIGQNRLGNLLADMGRRQDAERAYRDALKLEQQLAAEVPTEPKYRRALAASHSKLGLLLADTGRVQDAERTYRDALKLRQQLAADFPAMPEYRRDLAQSHNDLGTLLWATGRFQDAERAYRDALKLLQQLATDFPAGPDNRQELAQSHNDLGVLLWATRRVQDAERTYRDALKLRQQLAADFPTVLDYRRDLAQSHNNLGALLEDTGRRQDAERAYRDALNLRQQLAADSPDVPDYRRDLAGSHNNLGALLQKDTRRLGDAECPFRDALKLQRQLVAEHPTPDYQNDLAGFMDSLAGLLRKRKELGPARQLLEEAVSHHQAALKANPRHPAYRSYFRYNRWTLAQTLLDLGEHGAAADAAAGLVEVAVDPANDAYNATCFLCRCVPLAEHDAQLSDARRKDRAREYSDRALGTLRQALQNGFKDVAQLKTDTDLDPLRGRADF
jgi:serine/threonine protein kinase/tetratricopeptide (TPR) repeat protein